MRRKKSNGAVITHVKKAAVIAGLMPNANGDSPTYKCCTSHMKKDGVLQCYVAKGFCNVLFTNFENSIFNLPKLFNGNFGDEALENWRCYDMPGEAAEYVFLQEEYPCLSENTFDDEIQQTDARILEHEKIESQSLNVKILQETPVDDVTTGTSSSKDLNPAAGTADLQSELHAEDLAPAKPLVADVLRAITEMNSQDQKSLAELSSHCRKIGSVLKKANRNEDMTQICTKLQEIQELITDAIEAGESIPVLHDPERDNIVSRIELHALLQNCAGMYYHRQTKNLSSRRHKGGG